MTPRGGPPPGGAAPDPLAWIELLDPEGFERLEVALWKLLTVPERLDWLEECGRREDLAAAVDVPPWVAEDRWRGRERARGKPWGSRSERRATILERRRARLAARTASPPPPPEGPKPGSEPLPLPTRGEALWTAARARKPEGPVTVLLDRGSSLWTVTSSDSAEFVREVDARLDQGWFVRAVRDPRGVPVSAELGGAPPAQVLGPIAVRRRSAPPWISDERGLGGGG